MKKVTYTILYNEKSRSVVKEDKGLIKWLKKNPNATINAIIEKSVFIDEIKLIEIEGELFKNDGYSINKLEY